MRPASADASVWTARSSAGTRLSSRSPDLSAVNRTLLSVTDDGRAIMEDIRRHLATVITDAVSDWPEGLALAFAEGLERFASTTGSAPVDPGMPGE